MWIDNRVSEEIIDAIISAAQQRVQYLNEHNHIYIPDNIFLAYNYEEQCSFVYDLMDYLLTVENFKIMDTEIRQEIMIYILTMTHRALIGPDKYEYVVDKKRGIIEPLFYALRKIKAIIRQNHFSQQDSYETHITDSNEFRFIGAGNIPVLLQSEPMKYRDKDVQYYDYNELHIRQYNIIYGYDKYILELLKTYPGLLEITDYMLASTALYAYAPLIGANDPVNTPHQNDDFSGRHLTLAERVQDINGIIPAYYGIEPVATNLKEIYEDKYSWRRIAKYTFRQGMRSLIYEPRRSDRLMYRMLAITGNLGRDYTSQASISSTGNFDYIACKQVLNEYNRYNNTMGSRDSLYATFHHYHWPNHKSILLHMIKYGSKDNNKYYIPFIDAILLDIVGSRFSYYSQYRPDPWWFSSISHFNNFDLRIIDESILAQPLDDDVQRLLSTTCLGLPKVFRLFSDRRALMAYVWVIGNQNWYSPMIDVDTEKPNCANVISQDITDGMKFFSEIEKHGGFTSMDILEMAKAEKLQTIRDALHNINKEEK